MQISSPSPFKPYHHPPHPRRCSGLDGLAQRCAEYYKAGARFAKWRSVVSIPAGPSTIAVRDCAYGLARYAAIAQSQGLVSSSYCTLH